MKRVLSLVLALVLVLGMIPMGFAADSTAGTTLKGYGIIVGDENGNLNEDQNLNRAEMMVVLARMMGKGAEAKAFALPSTFTDLAGFGWAVPWIAYAEMNDWTEGVGANMFNPAGNVTAQEAAVFMLKALGYEADVDFNWTNAVEFATAKGLFAGVDTAATSPILRGDLFTMMITTLNTEVKSGAGLLGIVLGYMENPELEVVSVKALNLAQVEVKFNMEVDEDTAEDVGNYTLTDTDGDDLEIEFIAELQDDGKTVIIAHFDATEAEDIDQQTEAILEIDGVEAADNEELVIDDYVSEVFEYSDVTIPKALKAEVVGIDTIKVYFSEPIQGTKVGDRVRLDAADFEVEDDEYIIEYVEFTNTQQTEANVVLYSELEEGNVTLELSGMDDFAGFNVVKTTFELNVVEDNDAPTVVGYKNASRDEVTLVFNEDIRGLFDSSDDELASEEMYFYHTNKSNYVEDFDILGNELTLMFDEDTLLPEGTAYVYVVADAVEDLWTNANNRIVTKVEITVDTTAPTLKDLDVDLNEDTDQIEVTLTFSEDIDADSDFDDAYVIVDKDGEEVDFTVDSDDEQDGNDEIVLVLTDDPEDVSGTFKLTVQDLQDNAGNEIVKVTKDFEIDDLVAPDHDLFEAVVFNPSQEDQMIKVDFDDVMASEGAYSVLNLDKYMIRQGTEGNYTFTDLEDLDITPTIKLVDGGKAVEITIKSTDDDSDDGFDLEVNDYILIGRVADAAGNKSVTLSGAVLLEKQGNVLITDAEVTGQNTIVVTFDDKLTTFDKDDFEFVAGEVLIPIRISTTVNSDNETVATFKFDEDFTYDAKLDVTTPVAIVVNVLDDVSKNIYGETVDMDQDGFDVTDAYAPEIAEYDGGVNDGEYIVEVTSNGVIEIEFTEALDSASISKLSFSVEGETVNKVYLKEGDATRVVIEFTYDAEDTKDEPKVTQKYPVADPSDNEFKAASTLYSIDMR